MDFSFVNQPEYDFLNSNSRLGENLIFLTMGGSYAYGTNIEGSDIDVRGVTSQPRESLLGLSKFEQVIDNATDTTIYGFNRLVQLLLSCNPNCIELLGCKPEHYFYQTKLGAEFLANKSLFLSQKAVHSFGGYANQQLRRLQNAISHDALPQAQQEKHILSTLDIMLDSIKDRYSSFDDSSLNLFIDKAMTDSGLDEELFMDVSLKHYPLRDYLSLWSELSNTVRTYDKLGKRNQKKDDNHLNKHAMHLVRLYYMCFDILEKGEIVTYRPEREFLLTIRNGAFQNSDSTYKPEFFELVDELEKRLEYAKSNTSLPPQPDHKRIEEFMMDVNQSSLS
jgi:predicted nucleotidyltransferase